MKKLDMDRIAEQTGKGKTDAKARTPFAAKAVLAGAIAGAAIACTPDVKVNYTEYVPGQADAAPPACISACEEKEGVMRESGNTAGPNEMTVGGATLRFKGLTDEGSTKAAKFELEGCEGEKKTDNIKPGEATTFTLSENGRNESVDVEVVTISYDGAGLKLEVTITPLCGDAAGAGGAGGAGVDAGVAGTAGSQ